MDSELETEHGLGVGQPFLNCILGSAGTYYSPQTKGLYPASGRDYGKVIPAIRHGTASSERDGCGRALEGINYEDQVVDEPVSGRYLDYIRGKWL